MSGYGHLTLEERGRLRGMMERLKPPGSLSVRQFRHRPA